MALGAVKAAGVALWAVAAEKLALPSLVRASELLLLNADNVLASDGLVLTLMLSCCPLGGVRGLLQWGGWRPKAVAAVAGAILGWQSLNARNARKARLENQSVLVAEDENSKVWRSSCCPNGELLSSFYPGVSTFYHIFFQQARQHFSKEPCLGRRVEGGYEWLTYEESAQRAEAFGAGLLSLGVGPGQKLGVFSVNCVEWMLAELGGFAYGIINVALYATLGEEQLAYVVKHSEMSAIVCSMQVLNTLLSVIPNCGGVRFVIFIDDRGQAPSDMQLRLAGAAGVRLMPFSQVVEKGKESPREHLPPKPTDLAAIMYTSGTTGKPKGVMVAHESITSITALAPTVLARVGEKPRPGERHISYLPLAHIFEQVNIASLLAEGVALGFYGGTVEGLFGDIITLKPTTLNGVPRVFNRVHDRVMQMVDAGPPLTRFLVRWALAEAQRARHASGGPAMYTIQARVPLWDLLVFGKMKSRLGGCCRLLLSGGAPLFGDVQEFMSSAFGCPVVQGYGLTETCGMGTFGLLEDPSVGHAGPPKPMLELKLQSVPEMGYTVNDCPCPRGEICFKGVSVMRGYYKDPELTLEAMDQGWFHTGDIGQMNANGTISIIGRKKSIFKLSQGEYVAVEKLELQYATAKLVSQIFVHGDSLQSTLVAVVVPEEQALKSWAQTQQGQEEQGEQQGEAEPLALAALCLLPGAKRAVLEDLKAAAKAHKMKGFEVVKSVFLEPEPFSVENGLLTPTLKLRRTQLQEKYKNEIEAMYAVSTVHTTPSVPVLALQ